MKILLIHNFYKLSGGEDEVFRREKRLLTSCGYEVVEYLRDNIEITNYKPWHKFTLAARTSWAWDSHRDIKDVLTREVPDIAHFHNTFPLISPSAYYACSSVNVPVVQTLHNPRIICPAATQCRDGRPCEDCSGKVFPWPAVLHSCYQDSSLKSLMVASMLGTHRLAGTWSSAINRYIVSTDFYRRKFTEGGIPSEKMVVKPHFVETDPGIKNQPGDYALFIGRLSPEKGISTLLKAWERLKHIPLRIRGDGPLTADVLAAAAAQGSSVVAVPRLSSKELCRLMKGARFLVWPSEGFYETFGLVAIEAFGCGLPVISSRSGVMEEIVKDGLTGIHFVAGDPVDLAEKVAWAWSHPEELELMGKTARIEFERKYTRERNAIMLQEIYHQALNDERSVKRSPSQSVVSPKHVAN